MGLFDFLAPQVDKGAQRRQTQLLDKGMGALEEGKDDSIDALKSGYASGLKPLGKSIGLWNDYATDLGGGFDMYQNSLGLNGQQGYDSALGAFQQGPGYQFALDQANQNILRNNAATGGVANGGTLAALQDRAQQMQNMEFGNWQDRLKGFDPQRAIQGQTSAYGDKASALINQGKDIAGVHTGFAGPINQQYGNQASLIGQQQSANMAAEQQGWANALGIGSMLTGGLGAYWGKNGAA
jgi:hypothetical protein